MNRDIAERVIVRVLDDPDSHDQRFFVDDRTLGQYTGPVLDPADELRCPTAACLAGWAVWEFGGPDACRFAATTMQWEVMAFRALDVPHISQPEDHRNANTLLDIFYETEDNDRALTRFAEFFDVDLDALRRHHDEVTRRRDGAGLPVDPS